MEKIKVTRGVWLVQIPEHGLSVLCGCPPDVTKHLMRRGLITDRVQNGVWYETGPNAILLSDLPLQNGIFANMAEFPILQMFYRQGMIIPNHFNNNGAKPMVIGQSHQLKSLCEYLFRGTYGLANEQELVSNGVTESFAREVIREKLFFAYNKVRTYEELLELCETDSGETEIRPGLVIRRDSLNQYTFICQGQEIEVDLNLRESETYESPINLGFHKIKREYFSVIHIGEGDGWDQYRPCMSSLIIFQGKIYLIDTGPHILNSLTAAGISVNEIEGIFHTHAHDDHFAGLPSLARTDHRIKYYATRMVRASVMKKLAAIMAIPEKRFLSTFEVHDLRFNEYNNIDGLEVMPVFSPHPVETNVFFFRTLWQNGYRSYAHLADIADLGVLKKMLLDDPGSNELSHKIHEAFTRSMIKPVDLKKVDIGGGMIHGSARDFVDDQTPRIVFGHIARELTAEEKEIGAEASFGMEDLLIPSQQDYRINQAQNYLRSYFPEAAEYDLAMLLNCPVMSLNRGTVLHRKDAPVRNIYLVVNGVAEMIDADTGEEWMLSAGSLIGELAALSGRPSSRTFRTRSYVNAMEIPVELYLEFVRRNGLEEELYRVVQDTYFLQNTYLFSEMVSSLVQNDLARRVQLITLAPGKFDALERFGSQAQLLVVREGFMRLYIEDRLIEELGPGDFCGEESIFYNGAWMSSFEIDDPCEVMVIPGEPLRSIPIVEWKLLEIYEKRLSRFGRQVPR